MRAFFLFLVLANLAFFAYGHIAREGGGAESRIQQLQVAAERIKLVQNEVRAPARAPKAPAKVRQVRRDLARMKTILREKEQQA